MNKRKMLIVFLVLLGIISIAGFTYAVFTWAFKERVSGESECFKIDYNKGQDIGSENNSRLFMPSNDYRGGLFASVVVNTKDTCDVTEGVGTLYLTTDDSTSDVLLSSGVLKYQVIENELNLVSAGIITSKGTIPIYDNISINTTLKKISVSVWIDGSMLSDSNMNDILSSSYIGKISMRAEGR